VRDDREGIFAFDWPALDAAALWSVNGAAVALERDKRSLRKALKRVRPDGEERGHPRWRLPTIVDALNAFDAPAVVRPAKVDPLRSARPLRPSAKQSRRRPLIKTPVSPTVIVFPLARQRDFVLRHAARMRELSADQAYVHLSKQLQVQGNKLRRKGIAESVIDVEINNLRIAVRAALWDILFDVPMKSGGNSP
jgi:hypothetical protein